MAAPTEKASAAPWVPASGGIQALRKAALSCRGCDLYARATQTVFGEGPAHAGLVLVGEQPGDREDQEGHPFVGPAGQLLDRALEAAGIDRAQAYVTNVVKHFKWERGSGKRRIHSKPNEIEIRACRPWLEAELDRLRPRVLVCLGATAAQALLGRSFRITVSRGQWIPSPLAPHVLATAHPSSVLRMRTDREREAAMAALIDDLRIVAPFVSSEGTRSAAPAP
jgi:uracil-DNA glycosylase